MEEWNNGWMDEWREGRVNDGWGKEGVMDGEREGWMKEWMKGGREGGMDGWMDR